MGSINLFCGILESVLSNSCKFAKYHVKIAWTLKIKQYFCKIDSKLIEVNRDLNRLKVVLAEKSTNKCFGEQLGKYSATVSNGTPTLARQVRTI